MSKFNVGDRVKVIVTMVEDQAFGHSEEMDDYLGEIATVKGVIDRDSGDCYYLKEFGWIWDKRCLRRVRKAKTTQPAEGDKEQGLGVALPLLPVAPASPVLEVSAGVPVQGIPRAIINTGVGKFPELVAELRARGKKADGICSFAIEYLNKSRKYYINAPCHASIGGAEPLVKTALLLNLSGHTFSMSKKEHTEYKKYCDYIMARSPYSSSFKYFGIEDALENGVFMNVDKPLTEIAVSAIALRMGSEYPNKWRVFHSLVAKGFSENAAHLISYCVSDTGIFTGFCSSHKTISGACGAKGVLDFFRNGFTLTKGQVSYRKSRGDRYGPISESISKVARLKEDEVDFYFQNLLEVKDIGDGGWVSGYTKVSSEALNKAAENLEIVLKTKGAI